MRQTSIASIAIALIATIVVVPARADRQLSMIAVTQGDGRTPHSAHTATAARLNAAAAKIPPLPHARGERCATLRGQTGTDFYCASSVLRPQAGNVYSVDHLFSNRSDETWAEGKRGPGIGEWITIAFKEQRVVKAVIIRNGYQKNADTFSKNGRVRQLRLVFSQGETQSLMIEDSMELQRIPLEPNVRAHWVQFIIDDVYPGSAHEDTAITKLFVTADPER